VTKRITKIKFYSIARDVRDGILPEDIAAKHQVSRETVRIVRSTKTWPGYVTHKQAKASYIANAKERKFAQAQRAGLNPVRKQQRQVARIATTAREYVSRAEFEAANALLDERLDAHAFIIKKKVNKRVWPWSKK
jgi:hypothetical protein